MRGDAATRGRRGTRLERQRARRRRDLGGVSHGDVIKAIVADALGLHLDEFQRIVVDPASVTRRHATPPLRPFVVRLNDTGGDSSGLAATGQDGARPARASLDAVVGGGAGSA